MSDNKAIKFPAKHYIGFQARPSVDELPLAFMTPDGTDKAAEKRKATVDSWAKGYGYDGRNEAEDKLPAQSYENKPMIGFKMGRSIRHGGGGWGQGNVKWRIEDPRGFELEITSPNLAQIMNFSTIEKGEILEECIWARLGAENILVPVDSDVYRATVRNTERMAKSASMKDINIGDHAVLQNGDEGTYYGAFYIANTDRYSNYSHKLIFSGKKRHVFLMQRPGSDGNTSVRFFKAVASPKLSELFEGTAMTHEEAEGEVNKLIQQGVELNEAGQSYNSAIGVSIEQIDASMFTQHEEHITYDELIEELDSMEAAEPYKAHGNFHYALRYLTPGNVFADFRGHLVYVPVEEWEGKKSMMPGGSAHNAQYHTNPSQWLFNCIVMNPVSWQQGQLVPVTKPVTTGQGYWRSQRDEAVVEAIDPAIEDLPALKRYRMSMTTKQGNEIVWYR